MNPSSTLLHLCDLSTEIKNLSDLLASASADLGDDGVGFVMGSSADLHRSVSQLASERQGGNLLESRELRHDLRNKVAVIKGFCDLMCMDLAQGGHWARILSRLMELSDLFVSQLDSTKDRCGNEHGAALFA